MGEAGLEAQTLMDSSEKWQRFLLISDFHLRCHFLQILSEKIEKIIADMGEAGLEAQTPMDS